MGTDRVFSVVAWFTMISCTCVSARFTVLTEDSSVVVEWGETAILHCRTSIPYELTEVRWFRLKDGNYSIITFFRDGRDQQTCELPEYVGRTELVTEGLARGSVALKLFNVSVADEGSYRCYLETADYFDNADVELRVTALGSDPRIDIEELQDGGIKVVCRSAGWFPEPTLVNKDDKEEMKIQQEENGLYSIEYSRVLTKDSDRTFYCRFQTSFHRTHQESSVYVADGLFRKCADTTASIVFCIILSVVIAATAVTIMYLRIRHRNRSGASSAVRAQPSSQEVLLDQGSSNEREQTRVCEMNNTNEGRRPVLQRQDTLEQPQVCVVNNTELGPPVFQLRDTLEQPQVCVVNNTELGPPVFQLRDTLEQPQVCVVNNTELGPPLVGYSTSGT